MRLHAAVVLVAGLVAARAFSPLQRTTGTGVFPLHAQRTPPPTPSSSARGTRHLVEEMSDLRSEVLALRKVVQEVAGALVFCDDMAYREHQMMTETLLYADLNFTSARRPILLRHTVARAMSRYGLEPTPVERHWHRIRNETGK